MIRRRLGRIGPNINWQLVIPVLAGTLAAAGLGMLACFVVALAGGDGGTAAFGIPAAVVLPLASIGLLGARRLRSMPLRARDGFLAVTLAWVAAASAGAAPFMIEGSLPRAVDAFFESMSGFTTTGGTLIEELEPEPDSILLWRSITQWLGGIGIVVLVVAIAPATGLATHRVFFAETSGVTDERLTPRIADTAKILAGIYLTLTGLGFVAYLLAGMGVFDAVSHVLTTVSTAGFSTRTDSIGAFDSLSIELVAIAFMALGGVNFAFYWQAMRGRSIWPAAAEVRLYFLILLGAIAAVTASLALNDPSGFAWRQLREGAFAATTIVTTTGYITADFDEFNDFARALLVLLMFVGGCAGSTAGGMKVIRWLLLGKIVGQEVGRQLRPKAVQVLRTRSSVFSEEIRRGVLGFFAVYLSVAVVGTLAMLMTGFDLTTAAASVAATLNCIGPGLGQVGAAEYYGAASEPARAILSVLMLIGRLEVFTVLVLFTPAFWRPNVA